ncbi:MAG: hypothetical protein ABI114_11530, partial [Rhodanobacter sp.]
VPMLPSRRLPENRQMSQPPSRQRRHLHHVFAPIVLLVGSSSAVYASQLPALNRVDFSLGGHYASTRTTLGASTPNAGLRGRFNLEDDLGFRQRKAVPRVHLNVLIGDSQGFSFDYFSVNRSRRRVVERAFDYGGNHYDVTANVHGKLDFDSASVAYRWWFGAGSNVFGLGLGGAWYRIRARVGGSLAVDGSNMGEASTATGVHAWAPELQLGWRHAFNNQWRMYADVSGVKKSGGRLYGHIYHANMGLEWYPWGNLGLGAEYGYTQIKLDQRRHAFNDSLDMRLKGPSLFMKLRL